MNLSINGQLQPLFTGLNSQQNAALVESLKDADSSPGTFSFGGDHKLTQDEFSKAVDKFKNSDAANGLDTTKFEAQVKSVTDTAWGAAGAENPAVTDQAKYYENLTGKMAKNSNGDDVLVTKDLIQTSRERGFGADGSLEITKQFKSNDINGDGKLDNNDRSIDLMTSTAKPTPPPPGRPGAGRADRPGGADEATEASSLKTGLAKIGLSIGLISSAYGKAVQGKSLSSGEQQMYAKQFIALGTAGKTDAYKHLAAGSASQEEQQGIAKEQEAKAKEES